MDTIGKVLLVGGTGLLIGAAMQRASDVRERDDAEFRRNQSDLERHVREQKQEIERLRRTQDALLDKRD